jgi:hypothetical protein
MSERRFTIFEARNARLKELFLGATDGPIFDVLARLRAAPPAVIRHWNMAQITQVRSVEFQLTAEQAEAFLLSYAHRTFPAGWRVLSDRCPA